VDKVILNLKKMMELEGKGTVDKKIGYISELLNSGSGDEAKYIVRTLLSDLRIGISSPTIIESISKAFNIESDKVQEAYDLANDFAVVFDACSVGENELTKISLVPGRPINVMLAVKVGNIEEAFEVCGKPAAIEQKYDGFRMLINKDKSGKISLFTRKLENVTNQFPDVVDAVSKCISAESFILDSEVVGFNPKTGKYEPFEYISQRIKRKYNIGEMVEKLPVEINIFDCVFYNGKSTINYPFIERRKIVEKIVREKEKVIRPAVQIITDNEEEANKFYENALKIGEEGIMIKKLDVSYKQGRRVGYMAKMKPDKNELDLVIVGAEHGTGKRGGWLTSYIVACRDKEVFKEVGKVSSGLKEKEEEGFSYEQMTKLLNNLIIEEGKENVKIKPEVVVSVAYQNIQESPSYSSGYALRFPRILRYRPDRSLKDIASIEEIRKEAKKQKRK
jgi:DNA ligase-1